MRAGALAVGAGGNIEQYIERNENDPRIWDVANAKILHLHLLDARTFKLGTGLNPPPTPVTAEAWHQRGFPSYHSVREHNKQDGVAGSSWGEIVGVKDAATRNLRGQVANKLKAFSARSGLSSKLSQIPMPQSSDCPGGSEADGGGDGDDGGPKNSCHMSHDVTRPTQD